MNEKHHKIGRRWDLLFIMTLKAREYRARAAQCEKRALNMRDLKDREWQMTLVRLYRMLAEAESELVTRPHGTGACAPKRRAR